MTPCTCGCPAAIHEYFPRTGLKGRCAVCPPKKCPSYKPRWDDPGKLRHSIAFCGDALCKATPEHCGCLCHRGAGTLRARIRRTYKEGLNMDAGIVTLLVIVVLAVLVVLFAPEPAKTKMAEVGGVAMLLWIVAKLFAVLVGGGARLP